MKYADINRRVTEIVADYIQRGYSINTATMARTSSEFSSSVSGSKMTSTMMAMNSSLARLTAVSALISLLAECTKPSGTTS